MAPRSFWKGYLKLSLVTCPVAMIPAKSDGEKVRFHTLNRKTGNRVESRSIDAVTGKPVPDEDEVDDEVSDEEPSLGFSNRLKSIGWPSFRMISHLS